MKRFLKLPLKTFWRMTGALRRPFVRKFEAMVARGCASQQLQHYCYVSEETNLIMDHLVRELIRLQAKIERLEDAVEDLHPSSNGLGIVQHSDEDRAKVRHAG